jgi:hypothetical protein
MIPGWAGLQPREGAMGGRVNLLLYAAVRMVGGKGTEKP